VIKVFLTAGASVGILLVTDMLINTSNAGIHPAIPAHRRHAVPTFRVPLPYHLDESSGSAMVHSETGRALD
jgi:hypothetical protein